LRPRRRPQPILRRETTKHDLRPSAAGAPLRADVGGRLRSQAHGQTGPARSPPRRRSSVAGRNTKRTQEPPTCWGLGLQAGGRPPTGRFRSRPCGRAARSPFARTIPTRESSPDQWLGCLLPRCGLDRLRAGASFGDADQPRRRQGRGARLRPARCRRPGQPPSFPPGLAAQPRMRSRRSRSLRTRQLPPPDSTLRCQSSSRVMYSRGSTLSARSLVTLIAITSKPSTVSGMSRT
jgi:hypothetical protein